MMSVLQVLNNEASSEFGKISRRMGVPLPTIIKSKTLCRSLSPQPLSEWIQMTYKDPLFKSEMDKSVNEDLYTMVTSALLLKNNISEEAVVSAIKKSGSFFHFICKQSNPFHISQEMYQHQTAPSMWLSKITGTQLYIDTSGRVTQIDLRKVEEKGFVRVNLDSETLYKLSREMAPKSLTTDDVHLVLMHVKNKISPPVRMNYFAADLDRGLSRLMQVTEKYQIDKPQMQQRQN